LCTLCVENVNYCIKVLLCDILHFKNACTILRINNIIKFLKDRHLNCHFYVCLAGY
jgi:hypothetical protein